MSAPTHSPLPWSVLHGQPKIFAKRYQPHIFSGDGKLIVKGESASLSAQSPDCHEESYANAALIVQSVNGHAGLLARVAELERALSAILTDSDPRYGGEAPRLEQLLASIHHIATTALEKGGTK